MRPLDHLIELSAASGTALERGPDGDHEQRSSIEHSASHPAFERAGSDLVVSCQPTPLPAPSAQHPTHVGGLANIRICWHNCQREDLVDHPFQALCRGWRRDRTGAALRQAGKAGRADRHQGERLNFESPGAFFGRLTERRWALVTALQAQGVLAVRELARQVGRDVKRVHEDVQVLTELGLVERDDAGGVVCPCVPVSMCTSTRMSIMKTSRHEPATGLRCREAPSRPSLALALGSAGTAIEAQ